MYGLDDGLVREIAAAASQHGAERLVLFGSRARGEYRPTSDIDLAVYGVVNELALRVALDELPTLLRFDVVPVCRETDRLLLAEIERDGVLLYGKESDETRSV